MRMSLITPGNRRRAPRFNHQVGVRYTSDGTTHSTSTINVSETGARLVVRGHLPRTFDLSIDTQDGPLTMRAEKVWEQPLSGTGRILGVRFTN